MSHYAVEIHDVSMRFNLGRENITSLKEYMIRLLKKDITRDEFYALKNVSFNIERGDSFAILGSNGSGKSTLLKIISGIFKPTIGDAIVKGSVSPLIELGAGFDMELTAKENVFLNGALLGYSKKFLMENYDDIIDFSELHDFQDVPLKNFSSGMTARLGFSIATIVKPDILIVDEILSVGDYAFQEKCEQRMNELTAGGATLILVSHSIDQVKKVCRNAAWINKGELMGVGPVNEICELYSNH
ncbi:ABC transporter ATP-binding protein [Paenibacillus sp. FSL L8-0470]|uniref:ABC transporter ATP-binding protein n=1 Tax=unclassified Paenibacillus TaxID=185978 RepID=UPI0030F733F1